MGPLFAAALLADKASQPNHERTVRQDIRHRRIRTRTKD